MPCKSLLLLLCVILCSFTLHASPPWSNDGLEDVESLLVRKNERVSLLSTEYGEISAVHIGDEERGSPYYLQFITLEPNALFLPVLLHANMVFYVHSGAGRLSWADEDGKTHVTLRSGDVFSLRPGSIFFIQSNLETERRKLRIYAIFTNSHDNVHEPAMGPYSSIRDLILGFDKEVLRAAFQVPEEMIDELSSGTRQPAIVHAPTTEKKGKSLWEIDSQYLEVILRRWGNMFAVNKKKSGTKAFNLFDQKPGFKNRYGHSLIVNKKNVPSLERPNLSVFLVNLTAGSMMGPHWNPMASEVSIVLEGEGMITVVGPSTKGDLENHQRTRFPVGEGDVFVVPRLHPMAQIAFNNNSFTFMGFSSTTKKNHPQYLAGKASVLRTLEKRIVATSFGATNMSAFDRFMDQQGESVILECASCAEEEFRRVEEEMKRRREEEERKREEEEKKRQEDEEKKRREEEAEAVRREEEARKQREEEAKREEEEARRQEEKRKRREEEEEREARRKEEEEQRRRKEEEEAERREEEARRRREGEAAREEEEARRQEEERMRREEKEARAREKEEEEEQARRQEEEAMRRREEEERRQREEEEASAREEEERQRREEEERSQRYEEEKGREEKSEEEEEAKTREEEARERRKEAARREEEEARGQEEKAERREEEEARRREEEEEKETREREEGGGGDEERRRVSRRIWKLSDF